MRMKTSTTKRQPCFSYAFPIPTSSSSSSSSSYEGEKKEERDRIPQAKAKARGLYFYFISPTFSFSFFYVFFHPQDLLKKKNTLPCDDTLITPPPASRFPCLTPYPLRVPPPPSLKRASERET